MIALSRRTAPAAAALRARVDLRSGLITAGVVRLPAGQALTPLALCDLLSAARERWNRLFSTPALSVGLPFGVLADAGDAARLDAALSAAGFTPHLVTFEIEEGAFAVSDGPLAAAERLRSRGWGLALRCGDRPHLPLDTRARNLFRELVQPRCTPVAQLLADDGPLIRRLDAAKAAGLLVTIERLPPETPPAMLLAAGIDRFDRICGPA